MAEDTKGTAAPAAPKPDPATAATSGGKIKGLSPQVIFGSLVGAVVPGLIGVFILTRLSGGGTPTPPSTATTAVVAPTTSPDLGVVLDRIGKGMDGLSARLEKLEKSSVPTADTPPPPAPPAVAVKEESKVPPTPTPAPAVSPEVAALQKQIEELKAAAKKGTVTPAPAPTLEKDPAVEDEESQFAAALRQRLEPVAATTEDGEEEVAGP